MTWSLSTCPAALSTLALKALQRSNFVIVPCQASLPDVKDAVKTMEQIADAEDLSRAKIARSLIWTRVLPGFELRSAKHVREGIEGTGLPVFGIGATGACSIPGNACDGHGASAGGFRSRRRQRMSLRSPQSSSASWRSSRWLHEQGSIAVHRSELVPRKRVDLKSIKSADVDDAEVTENSRKLGTEWGAQTGLTPTPEPEAERPKVPLASLRIEVPDYLDRELALKAVDQRVTKHISYEGPTGRRI